MDRNAAVLPVDQFLDDGESHPGAFSFVASLQCLEQFKDLFVESGQYPRTVIADDELHKVSYTRCGKDHLAVLFIVVLDGIVNEIS